MVIILIEEERYREFGRERSVFGCASDKPEIRIFPIPEKIIPRILVFGNRAQSKTYAGGFP